MLPVAIYTMGQWSPQLLDWVCKCVRSLPYVINHIAHTKLLDTADLHFSNSRHGIYSGEQEQRESTEVPLTERVRADAPAQLWQLKPLDIHVPESRDHDHLDLDRSTCKGVCRQWQTGSRWHTWWFVSKMIWMINYTAIVTIVHCVTPWHMKPVIACCAFFCCAYYQGFWCASRYTYKLCPYNKAAQTG